MDAEADCRAPASNGIRGPRIVRSVLVAGCTLACLLIGLGVGSLRSPSEPEFVPVSALAMIDATALDRLADDASASPVLIEDLSRHAVDGLVGYGLLVGSTTDDRWSIDLTGHPRAADRASFGLLELGVEFEREGRDHGVLSGWGPLPTSGLDAALATSDPEAAARILAAVIELGGSVTGRVADVDDEGRRRSIESLAQTAGLDIDVHGTEVRVVSATSLRRVASWSYTCALHVPVVGGDPCSSGGGPIFVDDFDALDNWLAATTGSLVPGSDQRPSAEAGGVSWSNREAQHYRPAQVSVTEDGLALTARLHPEPSVDRLPYDSGLVFSRQPFGYGRFEFEVTVPTGTGLWPAIWLLDVEACESPGRCPGYASRAYHEIDVLETAGDDLGYFSVHWYDDQIRSASVDRRLPALDAGESITVGLERRPGLLVWSVDGEVTATIAGPARSDEGIHRSRDMMLILNLAVGGSFSGDRLIGRSGDWWGDTRVPAQFPDLGWVEASLLVHRVRVAPL